MGNTMLDDNTLELLKSMLGKEPPEQLQNLVFSVKHFADKVGSGGPLPAHVLALCCLFGDQRDLPKAPDKQVIEAAKEIKPEPQIHERRLKGKDQTEQKPISGYRDMPFKTLSLLCNERDLPPVADKDEAVEALEEYDRNHPE